MMWMNPLQGSCNFLGGNWQLLAAPCRAPLEQRYILSGSEGRLSVDTAFGGGAQDRILHLEQGSSRWQGNRGANSCAGSRPLQVDGRALCGKRNVRRATRHSTCRDTREHSGNQCAGGEFTSVLNLGVQLVAEPITAQIDSEHREQDCQSRK